MHFIHRMTVAGRLTFLVGLALSTVCVSLTVSGLQADRLAKQSERALVAKDVVADILPPPLYLIELRLTLSSAAEGLIGPQEAAEEVGRLIAEYETRAQYWRDHPPFGLERHLLGEQHEHAHELIQAARNMLPALISGNRDATRAQLSEVHRHYLAHRQGVLATVQSGNALAETSMSDFVSTVNALHAIQAVILLAALGLLSGSAWLLCRSITRPLSRTVSLARQIAAGDLRVQLEKTSNDETGQLIGALNEMTQDLSCLVAQVGQGSDSVATASAQISQGIADLSRRTEEQGRTLQQAAQHMGDLTSGACRNAESAKHADELAQRAATAACQGGAVVQEVIDAMQSIDGSSRAIADITDAIEGIAFQTNLLALNAAVEAARAGQQGQGFAVVASEVRKLAQRSAKAAKEIKALIGVSAEQIESGRALVSLTHAKMDDIEHAIRLVTDVMAEISSTSADQAASVHQISTSVTRMERTTQQNAALVEESLTATNSLQSQAQQLLRAVARFKLPGASGAQIAAATSPEPDAPKGGCTRSSLTADLVSS